MQETAGREKKRGEGALYIDVENWSRHYLAKW